MVVKNILIKLFLKPTLGKNNNFIFIMEKFGDNTYNLDNDIVKSFKIIQINSNINKNKFRLNENEEYKPAPICYNDFSVTDGDDIIILDMMYKDSMIKKKEIKQDCNYVGEKFMGEYTYKYFYHAFDDFDLYTSNIYYNKKNRDFNEYYMSQINLKNNKFRTSRGASLDSTYNDIILLYGKGIDTDDSIIYQMNDKKLVFKFDKDKKVEDILLIIE